MWTGTRLLELYAKETVAAPWVVSGRISKLPEMYVPTREAQCELTGYFCPLDAEPWAPKVG